MSSKEIRPRDLVELGPIPATKENVAAQLSFEAAYFLVKVIDSPHFLALHIKHDKYHFTKAGEEAFSTQLRLEMGPPISDLAYLPEVRRKAAGFKEEYGEAFKKNPNLFVVCQSDRDLVLEYARSIGRLTNPIIASLMDWDLT